MKKKASWNCLHTVPFTTIYNNLPSLHHQQPSTHTLHHVNCLSTTNNHPSHISPFQTNYVAQSGDPTGTGTGGVSVWSFLGGAEYFDAELRPTIKHNKKGLLSMINDGNNRHGSQVLLFFVIFFIASIIIFIVCCGFVVIVVLIIATIIIFIICFGCCCFCCCFLFFLSA